MSPVIQYALDLIPPIIWFFVYYLIFYRLHRPIALWRRRIFLPLVALWVILLQYVVNPMIFTRMSIGMAYLLAIAIDVIFVLLCGNLRRSLITVVYYNATALFLDFIFMFAEFILSGTDDFLAIHIGGIVHLSPVLQIEFLLTNVKILLSLGWAIFYYRTARTYPAKLPLRLWLLTVLPPVLSITALIYLWNAAETFLETGINIYGIGLVAGIVLFLLNCFLFYWHIKLLANDAEKAELQRLMTAAQNAAPVPQSRADSNWSREAGLSEAFVAKYQFSDQERRALELAILGKADKEIAKEMGVAPSTVKTYMHRVYVKTDTYGRGGVFSLIHGGGGRL